MLCKMLYNEATTSYFLVMILCNILVSVAFLLYKESPDILILCDFHVYSVPQNAPISDVHRAYSSGSCWFCTKASFSVSFSFGQPFKIIILSILVLFINYYFIFSIAYSFLIPNLKQHLHALMHRCVWPFMDMRRLEVNVKYLPLSLSGLPFRDKGNRNRASQWMQISPSQLDWLDSELLLLAYLRSHNTMRLQIYATTPGFYSGAGVINACPCDFSANILPIKPFSPAPK